MEEGRGGYSSGCEIGPSYLVCELPADILHIVLKKIEFKDRLALEMVSKGHRDTLRALEPWHGINLSHLNASSVTKRQFLKLLATVQPGFGRASSQIDSIAAIFESFPQTHRQKWVSVISPKYADVYSEARIASIVRRAGFPYKQGFLEQNPSACLSIFEQPQEACTILAAEHVDWLSQLGRKIYEQLLLPSLMSTAATARRSDPDAEKVRLLLNVSGAQQLSPFFLAACVVALSAVGFRVDLWMNKANDPSFLWNQVVELLQVLTGGDCTLRVNLAVSDRVLVERDLDIALEECMRTREKSEFLGVKGPQYSCPLVQALANTHSAWPALSKVSYDNFLSKVSALSQLQASAAAMVGCPMSQFDPGAKSRVLSETLILGEYTSVSQIAQFLHRRPEARLRLRFMRSNMLGYRSEKLLELFDALRRSGVFHLSFHSSEKQVFHAGQDPLFGQDWREDILRSPALISSEALQILELDFSLSPGTLDSIAHFLEQNQFGAEIWIHLRASWYTRQEEASIFARLAEMRSSDWGSCLRIVQHQGRQGVDRGMGGSGEMVASAQRELACERRREMLVTGVDWGVQLVWMAYVVIMALDRSDSSWSKRLFEIGLFFWALWTCLSLRRSLQTLVRGQRDMFGIVGGIVFGCFPAFLPRAVARCMLFYVLLWFASKKVLGLLGFKFRTPQRPSVPGDELFISIVEVIRSRCGNTGTNAFISEV